MNGGWGSPYGEDRGSPRNRCGTLRELLTTESSGHGDGMVSYWHPMAIGPGLWEDLSSPSYERALGCEATRDACGR